MSGNISGILLDNRYETAATAVLGSEMNHVTLASTKNRQMMNHPDEMDTLGKNMTSPMLYGKRTPSDDEDTDDDRSEKLAQTKRQTLNKILLLQADLNNAIVEFIKRTEPRPRPSRIKRQQKRKEKGVIQNWIDKKDVLQNDDLHNKKSIKKSTGTLETPGSVTPPTLLSKNSPSIPGQHNYSNKIPGQQASMKFPDKPCQPCNTVNTVANLGNTVNTEIKIAASEAKTKVDSLKADKRKTSFGFNDKFGSLVMYSTFNDIRRTENKKPLPGLPEDWEVNDLIENARVAEELDTKHAKEKEIRMKELELNIKISKIKIKELNNKVATLEKENKRATLETDSKIGDLKAEELEMKIAASKAEKKIVALETELQEKETNSQEKVAELQKYIYYLEKHNENLKEKLFQAKNINIDEIVKRQNDRHKENAEQKLKEKEIQHKELEERQNIKSATFCNFCELYQNNKSHFCNLFKKWIRVDNINLVFLLGASQDDVEPTAKDGKTKSTAIIKTYATRTNMFNGSTIIKTNRN